jgi:hypothetical protein
MQCIEGQVVSDSGDAKGQLKQGVDVMIYKNFSDKMKYLEFFIQQTATEKLS